jgi:hypothetical protein
MGLYLAKYRGMGTVLLQPRRGGGTIYTAESAEEEARSILRVGVSLRLQAALDPLRDDIIVVSAEVTAAAPWWLHSGPTGSRPLRGRVLVSDWELEAVVSATCPLPVVAARLGRPGTTFAHHRDLRVPVPPPSMALVSLVAHPATLTVPSPAP